MPSPGLRESDAGGVEGCLRDPNSQALEREVNLFPSKGRQRASWIKFPALSGG